MAGPDDPPQDLPGGGNVSSNPLTIIWGESKPPELLPLRAGPLTMLYQPDTGFVRRICMGDREVLRGIYAAVRDRNWATVLPAIRELRRDIAQDQFHIAFEAEHRQAPIHFVWHGELEGRPDGSIRYQFVGEALSAFQRNRIGFCILHPIRECAGETCRVRRLDGSEEELRFPWQVAVEQPVRGFHDLALMRHRVGPGMEAEVTFEGDAFETEDQRNWIDASYKTYCTPLRLPIPFTVEAGTRIRQLAGLRLIREDPGRPVTDSLTDAAAAMVSAPTRVSVRQPAEATSIAITFPRDPAWVRMPDIGTGVASHCAACTPAQVEHLARLTLSHLRVDLVASDQRWPGVLARTAREARELGVPLELVLHVSPGSSEWLSLVRAELTRHRVDITRVLILSEGQHSTRPDALEAGERAMGDLEVPIGAGTHADLYQLHLQAPPAEADFIAWSMNPQVHTFDTLSILETPAAAADQVRSAAVEFGKPLVISPATLKPRPSPAAALENPLGEAAAVPPLADPRQGSLVAAAWTAGVLSALAPTGIESLTLFEATGALGLMGPPPGCPAAQEFAETDMVYPVYHVLRAIAGARRCGRIPLSEAGDLAGLLLEVSERQTRMIVVNLSLEARRIELPSSLRGVRRLDGDAAHAAAQNPDSFWRQSPHSVEGVIDLAPCEVLFAECQPG
jgi:hypothetical protein